MPNCADDGFPCQDPDYEDFDKIARDELSTPISADVLVNQSDFCMRMPIDQEAIIGDMDFRLYLKTLEGLSGLYHLWIDHEYCSDHDSYTMSCAYVGKGPPRIRITSHIKNKWTAGAQLFVTFTAMTNRLSKYYEQLFLDVYNFDLNVSEKSGTKELYAVWDSERYTIGTHLNEVSGLSKMQSFEDWDRGDL